MAADSKNDLLRNTIDSSLDMIQVFEAVRDGQGQIVDFKWILNNKASESYYGDVIGKSLLTLNPGVVEEGIFDAFKNVVETGIPDQSVRHYVHEQFDGWFLQSAVKQGDGVATTTKDITDIKQAEEHLRVTLDSSVYVIQAFKAVRNEIGQIIDFTWVFTNNRWNEQYGEMIGKSLLEQNPGVIETGLFDKFVQVTETGITIDHEQYYSHEQFHEQWFHQTLVKMGDGFVMNTEDITQRKKAEQEVREKQALLELVLNNTESSIMLLKPVRDGNCRIIDFEYVFTNDQALKSVERTEVVGRKMTEEFPELKNSELLKKYSRVAETGESFKDEADINPYGYAVWAQVFAQKFGDSVLVTYFDITQRKQAHEEILDLKDQIAKHAEDKYRMLFNSIDQGFQIYEVLYDAHNKPVDFRYLETNRAFERQTGLQHVAGKLGSEVVPNMEPYWFDYFENILRSPEPLLAENYNEGTNRWYAVSSFRATGDGRPIIGALFTDITERKQREEHQAFLLKFSDALRAETDAGAIANNALKMLAAHLGLDRCYVGIALLDENRGVIPYQFGNEKVPPMPADGVLLSDFPDALRTTFEETLVITDFQNLEGLKETEKQNFAALGFAALVVANVRKEEKKPYWSINAVSATPRDWTTDEIQLVEEVTERTWAAVERAKSEEALKRSEEQFRRAIQDAPIPVIMHAEDGEVLQLSGTWTALTGFTLADISNFDLWLSKAYGEGADEVRSHMQNLFNGTTGIINADFPVTSKDGEVRHWSFSASSPGTLKDGRRFIVGMAVDITDRQQHEEHLKNFNLLLAKEVEDRTLELEESRDQLQSILDTTLVQMSILQAVRDTDGQIIDLEIKAVNRELEKETGRNDLVGKLYAKEYPGIRQTGLFDLIVKTIETGVSQSAEYFYPHEGFNKWFSCVFVKLGDGVVATNMDVSDRKQAEEQLRQLEADKQREIFEVSLSALEEERHRISESLHNGIGQILYGAKINLTGFQHGLTPTEFKETKAYISKLLTDAIKETRRISHQLMPSTLEQFGLKSAIDDICKQLSDSTEFHFHISGAHRRMEKYLELAIYRTAQELMTNVVKHAKAAECQVNINIGQKVINVSVIDNGKGMEAGKKNKPGIGLASIRSKIKLLNGEVNIKSSAATGTAIQVTIPQPQRQMKN